MKTRPSLHPAFGTGLHEYLGDRDIGRFRHRWNHDCFLPGAASEVRELFSMPEPQLAA